MKSRRSKGTSVALPPAARTRSSVSSRPPTVRPVNTRWAPSRANRSATAAPRPREAPVISAILPASRPAIVGCSSLMLIETGRSPSRVIPGHGTAASPEFKNTACSLYARLPVPSPVVRVHGFRAPSRGSGPGMTPESGGIGEQGQLHRDLAVIGVGERDRVVAGEAGVAEARRELVAAGFAHRAVQPIGRAK